MIDSEYLLPPALRAVLPSLDDPARHSDPTVHAKLFVPGTRWAWYLLAFDGADRLFGLVSGLEAQLAFFSLKSLSTFADDRDISAFDDAIAELREALEWGVTRADLQNLALSLTTGDPIHDDPLEAALRLFLELHRVLGLRRPDFLPPQLLSDPTLSQHSVRLPSLLIKRAEGFQPKPLSKVRVEIERRYPRWPEVTEEPPLDHS